jgi:hypothetical protein
MTTNHDPGRGLAIGSLFSGGVECREALSAALEAGKDGGR